MGVGCRGCGHWHGLLKWINGREVLVVGCGGWVWVFGFGWCSSRYGWLLAWIGGRGVGVGFGIVVSVVEVCEREVKQ